MYQKGYHHTEEEKAKIRASKLGAKNSMFGKKMSQESRDRMSKSHIGKSHPIHPSWRKRQQESLREFYNTQEGWQLRQKLRVLARGNKAHLGFRNTSENIEKMRLAKLGHIASDETRKKMSESHKGKKRFFTKEHRANLSKALKQLYATPRGKELRIIIDNTNKGNHHHLGHRNTPQVLERMSVVKRGKTAPVETRIKMRESQKIVWSQSEEYKNRRIGNIIRGNKKSPNLKELAIWGMLDEIQPNTWHFIGNGKKGDMPIDAFWGKMPDFWNGDHQFVEHYGAYWHRNHNPQDRVDLFANHGCKMLIIQELELMKHPDKVKAKIAEFVGVR